jgi:WD40 repeat protein
LRRALGAGALQALEGTEGETPGAGDREQWPPFQGRTRRFGDYELLEEVAHGGMGVVFRARQLSLNRIVALKMILAGRLATEREVQRFRAEAEAVAKLRHPNIVAIHEVGVHEGQHYFSMDLVQGRNLASLVREHPLPPATAARYVQAIAEAIQHAHQQGVLHRDLKPSNVLVDETDQPRITDFGLAKIFKTDSDITVSGQVLGSPNFMPPEQAAGRNEEVGPQSDLYSLGAILYHLLTGRPPFVAQTVQATLAKVLQSEPLAPRALNEAVPRNLETICLKCLEKDPRRRYRTAQELADELGRFLRGEPILARPASPPEKLWRWCRRNPALSASLGAALFLLVAIALGSALAAWRIAQARDAEKVQRQLADARAVETREELARLKVAEGWRLVEQGGWFEALTPFVEALALEAGDTKREAAHRARIAFLLQNGPQLRRMWFPGGPLTRVELSPDGQRVLTATASLGGHTGEAIAQVWDLRTGQPLTPPMRHGGRINFACFSPDGTRIATASEDRTARVWDAATGLPLGPPLPHTVGVVHAAFSPDSQRLATCTPAWPVDTNGYVLVWNPMSSVAEFTNKTYGMDVQLVLFAKDSQRLWFGCKSYLANLLDLKTEESVAAVPDCWCAHAMAYGPDGTKLLVAGRFGLRGRPGARVFDARTWWKALTPLLPHSDGVALAATFDPTGGLIATGGEDHTVRLWDAVTGQALTPPLKHEGPVVSLVFSPDGQHLLSASRDGTARVWDVETGLPAHPPLTHDGPVCNAWFTRDARQVITGSEDGAVRLWDLSPRAPTERVLLARGQVRCARFSPDGRWIVLGDSAGTVELRDALTGEPAAPPMNHSSALKVIKFTLDGRRLLTYCDDESVRVWDLTQSPSKLLWQSGSFVPDISTDGKRVAVPHLERIGRICDGETGEPLTPNLCEWLTNSAMGTSSSAHFSRDNRWLGFADEYGRVSIWDPTTLRPGPQFLAHAAYVNGIWFSPDSRVFATVSDDNTARIWDTTTGAARSQLLRHVAPVRTAAFSPDGHLLVTGSDDGTARLWASPSGQPLGQPLVHSGAIKEVCFSADGSRVGTASSDGTARAWDARTGEAMSPPLVHAGRVRTVEFSPDGRWLLTAGDDQTARLWSLPFDKRPLREIRSDPLIASDGSPSASAPSLEERWSFNQLESTAERVNLGQEQRQVEAIASSTALVLGLEALAQARIHGDLRATVGLCTRLCEVATNQWTWLFDRAYAKLRLRDYEAASAGFSKALQIEPHAAVCWLGRYLARSAASHSDAAADLRAALERAQPFSDLPREQIVTPDPSLPEQWETIVKDCTDDLRTTPQAGHLLCARGTAEAANTRLRLAKVDFERALELRPGEIEPWLALALIYRNQAARTPESWQKVAEAACRALALKPNDLLAKSVLAGATRHLQESK